MEIVQNDPRPVHLVGGGSTVGLKTICIAHTMGFRTFHLYGFDSSYADDAHHAYPQPMNDGERVIEVWAGDRKFKCAPWMVSQTNEFQELAAYLANEGCTITVNGDGLLPHVARQMMKDVEPSAADLRAKAIFERLPNRPVVGAEIGVFAGDLSSRLLSNENVTLLMVDSWKGDGADYRDRSDWHASLSQERQDAYYRHTMSVIGFAGNRAKVLRMASHEAAALTPDGSLDFAFIDADHSYEGCAADIAAWLPKLKSDGILCGHDYENTEHPEFGVSRAVDEFVARHGLTLDRGDNFTWFTTKPALSIAA